MKKMISFAGVVAIIFLMSLTVFAGSILEDLMHEDYAKIFFAKVVSYDNDGENPKLTYSATKKIKGDVIIGVPEEVRRLSTAGEFDVETGKEYLFICFDESNPTYVFETTSTDTAELKLKNTTGDMWKRFEEYLNAGEYEKAEKERMERLELIDTLMSEADTSVPSENRASYNECKTLADVFMIDREAVEELSALYSGDGAETACKIDKDDFFDTAEEIAVTEKTSLKKTDAKNGFMIVASDGTGNSYGVWIDKNGRIANSRFEAASAVMTRYNMKKADFEKICQKFLPNEATEQSVSGKTKAAVLCIGVIAATAVLAVGIVFAVKKRR